jgi:hypothetical protein
MSKARLREADYFSMQCELWDGPILDGSSSKTSPDSSPRTAEETLLPWLERWLGASSTYRVVDGKAPGLLSARTDSSSGVCWMRNGSEYRKGGAASSLSEILETGPVDPRYFLSGKACSGILRRAEKRGKELPPALSEALMAVATLTTHDPNT